MKTGQRGYKDDHDRKIRNPTKKIEIGRNLYLDRPPMTTNAAEHLASESNSHLLFGKTWPSGVIKMMLTRVMFHKDSIRSTVFVERATVAPP